MTDTDTAPAELVTEEIVKRFAAAYVETTSYTAALRAVAPMIAERARENWMIANGSEELAASIRRARGETP